MARRPRRFDDGGDVREGPHKGIDDDTRARALAFARRNAERGTESMGIGDSEEMSKPEVAVPRRSAGVKPARPSYDQSSAETKRLMTKAGEAELRRLQAYDKPLEPVAPEMMLPSGRVLQGVRGLAQAASRKFAPEGEAAAVEAGKQLASRAKRVVNKDRKDMAGQRKYEERMRREPARDADEMRMADEGGPNFKRGGKVKRYAGGGAVSASRRADGIAQRGKTRGKVC